MNSNKKHTAIIVCIAVIVLLTRGLTISHNMYLHCDEHVFLKPHKALKDIFSALHLFMKK